MKYLMAFAACFTLCVVYACIGAALGWKHGGGVIPAVLLSWAVFGAWKAIVGSRKKSEKEKK